MNQGNNCIHNSFLRSIYRPIYLSIYSSLSLSLSLGLTAVKEVKDLYCEKFKTLKKNEEDTRWKDFPCSWIGRINSVKISILSKVIYRFDSHQNSTGILHRNWKKALNFNWKHERLRIYKIILNNKIMAREKCLHPLFQIIMQYCSNTNIICSEIKTDPLIYGVSQLSHVYLHCYLHLNVDNDDDNAHWRQTTIFTNGTGHTHYLYTKMKLILISHPA